jgi:MOSC domain-containing protein YiiM
VTDDVTGDSTVVTAIHVALARRLPMRAVGHRPRGGGRAARALHDRAGTIFRVLETGDIAVGDTFVELPPAPGPT